jgi:hypothetical protein
MATTFGSNAIFTALLAFAAGTWVIAGQTTSGPPYETVRYINDGLRLEAYLYRPTGSGPFPLVIHRHSGTDQVTRWVRSLRAFSPMPVMPRSFPNVAESATRKVSDSRHLVIAPHTIRLKPAMCLRQSNR